jgi:hypothetical protein
MTRTDLFNQTLYLNCLIFQDDPSLVFPVEVLNNRTIDTLKEAIKGKKNALRYTDASALAIWKVSIANDSNLVHNLKNINLSDTDLLLPLQELKDVFVTPPVRKHIHIIVKVPPSEFKLLWIVFKSAALLTLSLS